MLSLKINITVFHFFLSTVKSISGDKKVNRDEIARRIRLFLGYVEENLIKGHLYSTCPIYRRFKFESKNGRIVSLLCRYDTTSANGEHIVSIDCKPEKKRKNHRKNKKDKIDNFNEDFKNDNNYEYEDYYETDYNNNDDGNANFARKIAKYLEKVNKNNMHENKNYKFEEKNTKYLLKFESKSILKEKYQSPDYEIINDINLIRDNEKKGEDEDYFEEKRNNDRRDFEVEVFKPEKIEQNEVFGVNVEVEDYNYYDSVEDFNLTESKQILTQKVKSGN